MESDCVRCLSCETGMEAAGIVEEVGSDVTEVRVGDRVCYAGMTVIFVTSWSRYVLDTLLHVKFHVLHTLLCEGFLRK